MLFLIALLILVSVLFHTILDLRAHPSASLTVDIAGRQRMLNSRYLKEILLVCHGIEADHALTRGIYTDSLHALQYGGDVITNLETGGRGQLPPAADAEIQESLRKQGELFRLSTEVADEVLRLVESESEYAAKISELKALNGRTHVAANQSVKLLTQRSAHENATALRWELFAEVLVAVIGISLVVVLSGMNRALSGEVVRRQRSEQALKNAHDELEDRVRKRTEELERSNLDLERFAFVISHDLQAPLKTISNYIEAIREHESIESEQHLDEFGRYFLENALDSAQRMRTLVHRVLEYSRVGNVDLALTQVDLAELLTEVVSDLDSLISESGAKVRCGPLPSVLGDRAMLGELFANLITNAVKFCDSEPPLIAIWADRKDNYWRCFVKDNGIGIAEEYRESVFQMFTRAESRKEYVGEGIGLAVCKKIVEYHGGEICIAPDTGKGTTFCFSLPVDSRWEDLSDSKKARRFGSDTAVIAPGSPSVQFSRLTGTGERDLDGGTQEE